MDEYAGRVIADRYRLPHIPVGEEPEEAPAFDTYSGQEVLIRQVPLPEVVSAEVVFASAVGDDEPPDTLRPEDDPGQRALRAALAASRVPDHPRLVQTYDAVLDSGSLWIVSEWVPGKPLATLLEERKLSPYRAAEIGADVLAALRAVHTQAWTHRNVTAETVLVCDDGRAILTGLAMGAAEEAICGFDPVPADRPAERHLGDGRDPAERSSLDAARLSRERYDLDGRRALDDHPVSDALGQLATAEDIDAYGPAGSPYRVGSPQPRNRAQEPHPSGESRDAASDRLEALPIRTAMTSHARERARQARLDLIGAVTERWAPEQAGPLPVRLPGREGLPDWAEPVSAPERRVEVGPPADLWALGVLLFRAIQGYPPFPEDDPRQLMELVRTEPPAFAEDCGPLRPIVESLLRKDPDTRPELEEVRGWLRSLIRTAPEPDIGRETVEVPADMHKVMEVRRRGEVARRQRIGALTQHGKHARDRSRQRRTGRLGLFVGLLLIAVALALAATALLLPSGGGDKGTGQRNSPANAGNAGQAPPFSESDLSNDVALHEDPEGFQLQLSRELTRQGKSKREQILFDDGDDVEMLVVPGRDSVEEFGDDLADYQRDREPELKPYRESEWGSASAVRKLIVGGASAVQSDYTWRNADKQEVYARNLVLLHENRFHIVLVMGPMRDRSDISRFFEKAAESYRVTR